MDHCTALQINTSRAIYHRVDFFLNAQTYLIQYSAVAACLVNFLFITLIIRGGWCEELPMKLRSVWDLNKKRFLLVANRAAVDGMTSLVALYYLYLSKRECDPNDILGCTPKETELYPLPLQVMVTLDYWTVALSYTGVAMLTVYAVREPFRYKTSLQMRDVLICIIISYLLQFALIGVIYAVHWFGWMGDRYEDQSNSMGTPVLGLVVGGLIVSFDTNGMIYLMLHGYYAHEVSYWVADLCANTLQLGALLMAFLSLAIPIIMLVMAMFSYGWVAITLCHSHQNPSFRHHRWAVIRLGMHVAIFGMTVVMMAMAYFNTVPVLEFCRQDVNTLCDITPIGSYVTLNVVTSIAWFARMIADPIIDLITDKSLRNVILPRSVKRRRRVSTITTTTRDEMHKVSVLSRNSSNHGAAQNTEAKMARTSL